MTSFSISILLDTSFTTFGHRLLAGMLFGLAVLTVGCGTKKPKRSLAPPADTTSRQAALTLIDSLRQDLFRSAFDVQGYTFTRRIRTVEVNATGATNAERSRVLRYGYQAGKRTVQLRQADSSGSFDLGFLGRFASAGIDQHKMTNLGRHVLSKEPPYLSKRNRDAFRYRLLGDTLIGRRSAHILSIRTRHDADSDQPLEHARLYVDGATHQLVGVNLTRQSRSLLLSERSRLAAFLQPLDTSWVPARTHFVTHVDIPAWSARAFRTSSSFIDYTAINSRKD